MESTGKIKKNWFHLPTTKPKKEKQKPSEPMPVEVANRVPTTIERKLSKVKPPKDATDFNKAVALKLAASHLDRKDFRGLAELVKDAPKPMSFVKQCLEEDRNGRLDNAANLVMALSFLEHYDDLAKRLLSGLVKGLQARQVGERSYWLPYLSKRKFDGMGPAHAEWDAVVTLGKASQVLNGFMATDLERICHDVNRIDFTNACKHEPDKAGDLRWVSGQEACGQGNVDELGSLFGQCEPNEADTFVKRCLHGDKPFQRCATMAESLVNKKQLHNLEVVRSRLEELLPTGEVGRAVARVRLATAFAEADDMKGFGLVATHGNDFSFERECAKQGGKTLLAVLLFKADQVAKQPEWHKPMCWRPEEVDAMRRELLDEVFKLAPQLSPDADWWSILYTKLWPNASETEQADAKALFDIVRTGSGVPSPELLQQAPAEVRSAYTNWLPAARLAKASDEVKERAASTSARLGLNPATFALTAPWISALTAWDLDEGGKRQKVEVEGRNLADQLRLQVGPTPPLTLATSASFDWNDRVKLGNAFLKAGAWEGFLSVWLTCEPKEFKLFLESCEIAGRKFAPEALAELKKAFGVGGTKAKGWVVQQATALQDYLSFLANPLNNEAIGVAAATVSKLGWHYSWQNEVSREGLKLARRLRLQGDPAQIGLAGSDSPDWKNRVELGKSFLKAGAMEALVRNDLLYERKRKTDAMEGFLAVLLTCKPQEFDAFVQHCWADLGPPEKEFRRRAQDVLHREFDYVSENYPMVTAGWLVDQVRALHGYLSF